MPKLDVAKLNAWYTQADSQNSEYFSETRTNVLLIAGEHYSKAAVQRAHQRIRSSSELTDSQKLRITKNHIHRINRAYVASILSYAPGVTIVPQKENELQDQKSAELNLGLWQDAKRKYRLKEKVREWARDYVGLGEVGVLVKFDPNKGRFLGYSQKVDENGEPVFDEMMQPVADEESPQFAGEFVFERLFAFNVLPQPGAKSMRDTPICIRKMVDPEALRAIYKGDEEKLKFIGDSAEEEFIVFDSEKGRYSKEDKQICFREYYWPPCHEYPEGYFAHATQLGILEEGPLPFGVWPIAWAGFDEHPTAARGRSILKVARPWQAEINRASGQQAMHQITVGDDKIIYQAGTKLAPGSLLPGVRGVTYQGMAPQILPGRDGSQFGDYVDSQVRQLYEAVDLAHLFDEKPSGAIDPYALLYRGVGNQQKFSEYSEKFEQFLVDLCMIYLELAREYMSDEDVIAAIGTKEQVNLAEFRSKGPLRYRIQAEAQQETIETKLGKQLTINHALQYVGNQLGKDDIGKLMRAMPFGNFEEAFSDFTLDADNAKNMMLSIERGQVPLFSDFDTHDYMTKRLAKRMREPDFPYLAPHVQAIYAQVYGRHRDAFLKQQEAIQRAKSEFIPVGGALIATDMYVPNEKDPGAAPKRARIPYQALEWLVKQLETQGMALDTMEQMNQQTIAEMAAQIMNSAPPPSMGGRPMPGTQALAMGA